MFDGHYKEKQASVIPIPNIRFAVFERMMRCIYTGARAPPPVPLPMDKHMRARTALLHSSHFDLSKQGWPLAQVTLPPALPLAPTLVCAS